MEQQQHQHQQQHQQQQQQQQTMNAEFFSNTNNETSNSNFNTNNTHHLFNQVQNEILSNTISHQQQDPSTPIASNSQNSTSPQSTLSSNQLIQHIVTIIYLFFLLG